VIANPFYAITIDDGLTLPHEPMISEDDWIEANVNLISELGPKAYLRNLLSILKGRATNVCAFRGLTVGHVIAADGSWGLSYLILAV